MWYAPVGLVVRTMNQILKSAKDFLVGWTSIVVALLIGVVGRYGEGRDLAEIQGGKISVPPVWLFDISVFCVVAGGAFWAYHRIHRERDELLARLNPELRTTKTVLRDYEYKARELLKRLPPAQKREKVPDPMRERIQALFRDCEADLKRYLHPAAIEKLFSTRVTGSVLDRPPHGLVNGLANDLERLAKNLSEDDLKDHLQKED